MSRAAAYRLDRLRLRHLRLLEVIDREGSLAVGELDCVIDWLDETIASTVSLDLLHVEPLWAGRIQVFAATGHRLARRKQVRPVSSSRPRSGRIPRLSFFTLKEAADFEPAQRLRHALLATRFEGAD